VGFEGDSEEWLGMPRIIMSGLRGMLVLLEREWYKRGRVDSSY
jgi:hypothetical protein